jgi:hypothetical protein
MTSTIGRAGEAPQVALRAITMSWVLKRAALGIGILFVAMSLVAWLMYASIDETLDAGSEPALDKANTALQHNQVP